MQNNYQNQQGKNPRKQVINRWEGTGIARPRSGNDNDTIKFFGFTNGGGAIHFTLACTEIIGADANGNPRTKTAYIPVNIMTNKSITEQQLRAVVPGMKLHIIGSLAPEFYDSRKTGQKVPTLVVNAFVLEVLEMPMQMPAPQPYYGAPYPQQPQYPAPAPAPVQQPYPVPQYGGYPPQPQAPVQYPQYPAQGVQYPAPAPAPAAPVQQPQAPQYQGGYPRQQAAPAPAQAPRQAQAPVPPYYQPAPAPAAPADPDDGDMPADMAV